MPIFKKGNPLYSIVNDKCPRCHQGDLWVNKSAYKKGFTEMPSECAHCGQKYDLEQGFWYGAMYISYALGVLLSLVVVLSLTYFFDDLHAVKKAIVAMLFLVVLSPLMFRYSRKIWANIFIRFDRKYL